MKELNRVIAAMAMMMAAVIAPSLALSNDEPALTVDERADVRDVSDALDTVADEQTPAVAAETAPAREPIPGVIRPSTFPLFTGTDLRTRTAVVKIVIPQAKIGEMNLGVPDQKRSAAGGGAEIAYSFLNWLRKDTDSPLLQILKGVTFSADVQFMKGTNKFTKYLRTVEKTGTSEYTQQEWNDSYNTYPYNGPSHRCDMTYRCTDGNICCDYTYSVRVYGTSDGHLVAWQKQSIGFRVGVPVVNLKDRVVGSAGLTERLHELAFSNDSDGRAERWRASHNWSVEGSVRAKGPIYFGGGYERSFAGYQNQIIKGFMEVDLGRIRRP